MSQVLDHEMKKKIMEELVNIELLANEMAADARQLGLFIKTAPPLADLKDAINQYEKDAQEIMLYLRLDLETIEVADGSLHFGEGS
jgi:hypothetical protein